jgi:ketoreductase RED1
MEQTQSPDALSRFRNVAVIGAGVIGSSWTALFLAHGLNVVVSDPRPDVETEVRDELAKIAPTLDALGLPSTDLDRRVRFEADTARAVEDVDVVQENGPERLPFKQELWAKIEKVSPQALLLSSSSSLTASQQAALMKYPERLLIGHPFNPPHLIPLVEVVPGEKTDPKAIEDAVAFYSALGKVAKVIHKEIRSFVANRLQGAIFRECVYLVKEGVVSVDELDDVVTNSIGLRWAAGGPFQSFHLAGGSGGISHFFQQFAPGMRIAWKGFQETNVEPDEATTMLIIEQVAASYGKKPMEELERRRDRKQLAILRALAAEEAEA